MELAAGRVWPQCQSWSQQQVEPVARLEPALGDEPEARQLAASVRPVARVALPTGEQSALCAAMLELAMATVAVLGKAASVQPSVGIEPAHSEVPSTSVRPALVMHP